MRDTQEQEIESDQKREIVLHKLFWVTAENTDTRIQSKTTTVQSIARHTLQMTPRHVQPLTLQDIRVAWVTTARKVVGSVMLAKAPIATI